MLPEDEADVGIEEDDIAACRATPSLPDEEPTIGLETPSELREPALRPSGESDQTIPIEWSSPLLVEVVDSSILPE